ncbi:hypothetical protein [Anianabacter salinae]|uniref:hypothetical protein n=1 Tax=Anianabacter salinae TaxID=2851023 RepID=UPI00225E6A84|nr:hypothetical protein [Anianabacter salinae]MBV0913237.1 hypothetical protein [Anianabacter salinae]
MPLAVMLPLVVVGIAGIVGLLHLLGYTGGFRMATGDDARAAWLRQFPEDTVTGAVPCSTGSAALVDTGRGPGLVWAFGADSVCRMLDGGRARITRHGLRIRFPDFNAPSVTLAMPPDEAAAWAARINEKRP